MALLDTPWCGYEADKLYLQSGKFSSTIKTSQFVGGTDTRPTGITWDGTNTPWSGRDTGTLHLQSGQFTATVKTSIVTGGVVNSVSWDGVDSPWVGDANNKLFVQSGQFTATIKTSLDVTTIDTNPHGISWDGLNSPWVGHAGGKLHLQSGQFTSTMKTSLLVTSIDLSPSDITWDGTDTPWNGQDDGKLYLQSGQFASTIKTSQSVAAVDANTFGISVNDVVERLAPPTPTDGDVAISLPLFAVQGGGGATGGITLPIVTVLSGVSGEIDASITLPVISISGWSLEDGLGIIDLPVLTMNGNGMQGEVGNFINALFDLPLGLSSRAYNGSAPECVVMNTKNFAVSEYLNFGFNSYTRFNGADLVCDQNGVYEMDSSSTDDSSSDAYKIKAAIKTGRIDAYKERIQRLRNAWLNYQTDGDARIMSTANKTKTRTYDLPYKNIEDLDEMVERRVKFERGIKDRYFDFKIENIDGSNIEVDKLTIMLEPVISKRR